MVKQYLTNLINKGNTAGRTPYGSAPHLLRPMEVSLKYSFFVILHKILLMTVRPSARFAHSDEKTGGSSAALSLRGIA